MKEQHAGWIKIHRRIRLWEHYGDIPCRLLFLHILVSADRNGRLEISLRRLAGDAGLSFQEARTAAEKLKASGEIAVFHNASKSAPDVYEIKKWDLFQTERPINTSFNTSCNTRSNTTCNTNEPLDGEAVAEESNTSCNTRSNTTCNTSNNTLNKKNKEEREEVLSCPVRACAREDGRTDMTGQDISSPGEIPDSVRVYPAVPEEVSRAAEAMGYSMSVQDAAEWLRMNESYGWRDACGSPIRTWRRLLRGHLRKGGYIRLEDVRAEMARQAELREAERREREERRKAREAEEAAKPKISGAAAVSFLLGGG